MAWSTGNWGQNVANIYATMQAEQKKKKAAAQQQAQVATTPTYTAAPEQMTAAGSMLPGVNISTMPEYAGATKKVDITKLPQYGAAATKTTIDPEYYKNRWTEAEGDISKSYMKKGGFYDRMMEGLNERGLGTSGEMNFQTREVGSNLAEELAKAYQGIETERMGQQAGLDESYAGRMGGLLGTQAGYDQNQISNLLNLLSTRTGTELTTQQGKAGLAQQLADARNALIGGDYQAQMQAEQVRQALEADKLGQIANLAGQGAFEDQGYDEIMNAILGNLGYPVDYESTKKKAEEERLRKARITPFSDALSTMQSGGVPTFNF